MAEYYYFNPTGKWKYDGEGLTVAGLGALDHDIVRQLNGGSMPGISGDGKSYTIVIIDDESWPRLIPAPATAEQLQDQE